ncbi:phosphoribosylformylglycinamidine synthase isoform X2 [Wolffia australiana]
MACRSVLRSVLLPEPWRSPSSIAGLSSSTSPPFNRGISPKFKAITHLRIPLKCSLEDSSRSPSSSPGEQKPPQEAVLKAISVSKWEGRNSYTTNIVMGGTVTDDSTDEWRSLDQKVNSYPTVRGFTAIGTGGDDFIQSMVVAVESVLQKPIPEGHINSKFSSRGKYVSVNIGPIQVVSSEQVQAIYNAMRQDNRMKYFL